MRGKLEEKIKTYIFVAILLLISSVSIGYSSLQTLLNINSSNILSYPLTLYYVLEKAANEGEYATTYTRSHQDSMSPGTKNIYYWKATSDNNANAILDKNNVIFAGFCWQMIRTTDTGGVKLLYNGEAVDNKCLSTRGAHTGVIGTDGTNKALNSSYVYGTTYEYNPSTNNFTVKGSLFTKTWSDANFHVIIGRYTCANGTNTTCSTLYHIDGYVNSTTGYVTSYTIGNTVNYSEIGTSPFNGNPRSPAMVGYKFNTVYNYLTYTPTGNAYFGTGATWNGTQYTLTNPVKISNNLTTLSTHHYTCLTDNATTCTELAYVHYYTGSDSMYYIKLTDGTTNVQDALNSMLNSSNVNRYNSNIKGEIEAWYAMNLLPYNNYIEDTIYCNDRTINTLNGWNGSGGDTTKYLYFKGNDNTIDLSCTNSTDKFSTANEAASLNYKTGLLTSNEMNLLNNDILRNVGDYYWNGTPKFFSYHLSHLGITDTNGALTDYNSLRTYGVRPAISLIEGTEYILGDGTRQNPYVIETTSDTVITFNLNKGDAWTSSTCPNPFILADGECKLVIPQGQTYTSLPTPTRGDIEFGGWYTSQTGGVQVLENQTQAGSANQTLYAHWENVEYTITYLANGGTGTMGTQTGLEDNTVTLNANSFTRTDYGFVGWAKSASGTVVYRNRASVSLTGNMTLYAIWGSKTPTNLYYTGASQTFKPTYTGKYKIELWGAQGGRGRMDGKYTPGGRGNKVTATLELTKGTTYYVYVGGAGGDGGHTAAKKNYVQYVGISGVCLEKFHSPGGLAGWNGGGVGGKDCSGGDNEPEWDEPEYYKHDPGGGGGGATDFRTGTAASTRILVAGGGAGSIGWDTAYSNADVLSNSKVATNSNSATHTSNGTGEAGIYGGNCGTGGGGGGYYGGKTYANTSDACGNYSYNGTNYITSSATSTAENNRIWGCNTKNDSDRWGSTCTSAYGCKRFTNNACGSYDGLARITFVGD